MVQEILKKALADAVGYYNDGMSANDAIIKSADEHDLTLDQTDRVVESFNTAKTINYFDKNASNRAGNFELASKKDITLALFGRQDAEKKASVPPLNGLESVDSSFYLTQPDTSHNRRHVFTEKRAALLDCLAKAAEEKWAHGYSDNTFQGMAYDAYSSIKAAESDIDSALGTIDSYLYDATAKIAAALSKGPYDIPEDRANLFKAACPHKLVIREVSKFSTLLKEASGGDYVNTPVVDTEPIDDLLKEADDIMQAVEQRTVYRQKKAAFRKKAEELKRAMLRDPSMVDKVPSDTAPEDFLHSPEKRASGFGDLVGGNDKVIDNLIPVESRKDTNEALRDEARGALLADLLSADPILQDADPRQVASIYKSIIASAPRVSLNKEVVRSVLRGAINSIAISPNDTKVLTDVDRGINTANTLSGLDSSVKDSAL